MTDYAIKNISDLEDSAVKFGLSPQVEARFGRAALDAQKSGFSYQKLEPNYRQGFGHVHKSQEETYVIISGGGRMKIGDNIVAVDRLDGNGIHFRDCIGVKIDFADVATDGAQKRVFETSPQLEQSRIPFPSRIDHMKAAIVQLVADVERELQVESVRIRVADGDVDRPHMQGRASTPNGVQNCR